MCLNYFCSGEGSSFEHHKKQKWRAFGESLDFGYIYTVLFILHRDFIAQIFLFLC